MKKLIERLQNNIILKRVLYVSICILCFLYIFSIPSFSGRVKLNLIPYLFMGLLVVATLIYSAVYAKRVPFKPFIIVFAFAVWCGVGTLVFSHNFRGWLTIILLTITSFTLFIAFVSINNNRLMTLIIAAALFSFCIYYIAFYSKTIFDINALKRGGFQLGLDFDNTNSIGFYMFLLYTISLFRLLNYKKRIDLIFIFSIVVALLCGILTGSRSFFINVLISTIAIVISRFKTKKWLAIVILASIFTLAIVIINLPFASFIKEKFLKMFSMILANGSDTSATERILWQVYGIYLGSKNPFIGYGMNGYAIYSGVGTYTHGNFAEIFCDYGVIGILLFYGTLFILARKSFYGKNEMHFLVFTFCCVFFLDSVISLYYTDKSFYVILGMSFALVFDTFKKKQAVVENYAIVI